MAKTKDSEATEKNTLSYKKGAKYILKRPYVGGLGVFSALTPYELTETQFNAFNAANEIKEACK